MTVSSHSTMCFSVPRATSLFDAHGFDHKVFSVDMGAWQYTVVIR